MRLSIFLFFFTSIVFSQEIDESFISGVWKVTEVKKSPEKPPFSLMKDSFANATFIFNDDKTTKLETTKLTPFFNIMISVVNNSNWKIQKQNNNYFIVIGKDDKKELEILVEKTLDEVFFKISNKNNSSLFVLKLDKKE